MHSSVLIPGQKRGMCQELWLGMPERSSGFLTLPKLAPLPRDYTWPCDPESNPDINPF